jgi:hypothetical protein
VNVQYDSIAHLGSEYIQLINQHVDSIQNRFAIVTILHSDHGNKGLNKNGGINFLKVTVNKALSDGIQITYMEYFVFERIVLIKGKQQCKMTAQVFIEFCRIRL